MDIALLPGRFIPGEIIRFTRRVGGEVDSTECLDVLENKNILPLQGIEARSFGRTVEKVNRITA